MLQASSGGEPPVPFAPVVVAPPALPVVLEGPVVLAGSPDAPLPPELPVALEVVLGAPPALLVLLALTCVPTTDWEAVTPVVADPSVP